MQQRPLVVRCAVYFWLERHMRTVARETPEGERRRMLYQEFLNAQAELQSFAKALKSKLCQNAKIDLVVCGAYSEDLQKSLEAIFGGGLFCTILEG